MIISVQTYNTLQIFYQLINNTHVREKFFFSKKGKLEFMHLCKVQIS